jgi:hypothetical protein
MKPKTCAWLVTGLATATLSPAAFAPGGAAYTKRAEPALLSEPQMLATPVARIPYARQLKVDAVKGAWLKVSEGEKAGWVFGGNLAEEKPSEKEGVDGLSFAPSETSAAAAARPLMPAAEEYSARHNLAKPADDMKWLTEQKSKVDAAAVQEFLKEQKKGEFQ